MDEPFDPFGLGEEIDPFAIGDEKEKDVSFLTTTTASSSFISSPSASRQLFDTSFDNNSIVSDSNPSSMVSKGLNTTIDSDIYSELFKIQDFVNIGVAGSVSCSNSNTNSSSGDKSVSNRKEMSPPPITDKTNCRLGCITPTRIRSSRSPKSEKADKKQRKLKKKQQQQQLQAKSLCLTPVTPYPIIATPKKKNNSKLGSPLVKTPKSPQAAPSAEPTPSVISTKSQMKLPVFLKLHETMSCIYDGSVVSNHNINNSLSPSSVTAPPECEVDGCLDIIPNKFIQGQKFFVSIKDPNHQIQNVTAPLDSVQEIPSPYTNNDVNGINGLITDVDNFGISPSETSMIPATTQHHHDPFVQEQQKNGCRVFQIDIPKHLIGLNANPIHVLRFKGSEFLRPIPLLVNCKVRVAGNYCRVGVKVRSNPTNKKNIKDIAILMAIPPDVIGETMKMSLRGGVWDPMRRIIIWSSPFMKSGETIEFQLQFEYTASSITDMDGNVPDQLLPRFPVLVRCDSMDDQLSDIEIQVGGETYYDANGVGHRQGGISPFKMNLSTSYRLFHRKV